MSEELLDTVTSLTLGELARMPVERRFDLLLPMCLQDVRAALDELRARFREDWPPVSVERVVWALALNVALTNEEILAAAYLTGRRQPRTTLAAELGDDHQWHAFWSSFAGDVGHAKAGRLSNLAQFALFVACEQREDWQWPADRPRVQEIAKSAQEIAYGRYYKPLRSVLRSAFAGELDDFDGLTQDTFYRVFRDYWKEDARLRFLGTGGALAFLSSIGRNACRDELRKRGRRPPPVPLWEDDEKGRPRERKEVSVEGGQTTELFGREHEQCWRECLQRIEPKQGDKDRMVLICQARWFHRERNKDIAKDWGITTARVSQITKDTLKLMSGCLRARGIQLRSRKR